MEALAWVVAIAVLVYLIWKSGGYRVVGIIGLGIALWVAERRYRVRKTAIEVGERKAADEFSVKVAPRIRERRRRQAEYYRAREELRRLEAEYVATKEDRAGRIAELWNLSFGRSSGEVDPRTPADSGTSTDADGDDEEDSPR